ncbi:MAG: choice-of-anchor D domain-containing protein [Myxococcota bacterium]
MTWARRAVLLPLIGVFSGPLGCGSDSGVPGPPGDKDTGVQVCTSSPNTCPANMVCNAGVCEPMSPPPDGGVMMLSGKVSVDPVEINFGAFLLGVPVTRTLSITNRGTGDLHVLTLEVEQNTAHEFEVIAGEDLPHTLAVGDTMAAQIRYTAHDGHDDHDRLRVVTDDPMNPVTIVPLIAEYKGFSEIAVVADPKTSTPEIRTIDFGQVTLTSSRTQTFFIKNIGDGNAVLEVSAVRTEPNPSLVFSVVTSTGVPILLNRFRTSAVCNAAGGCDDPGTHCTSGLCVDDRSGQPLDTLVVSVTFSPGAIGPIEEALVIANDEGDGDERTLIIRLVGEGIQAALDVSPNPIDFGTLFVGFPENIPVQLSSTGGDVLEIRELSLIGAPVGFALGSTLALPFSMNPMQTVSFSVIGDPPAASVITGNLHIVSSDPIRPVRDIPLGGTALVPPVVGTSTPGLDFGAIHVFRVTGQNVSLQIRVTNSGGSPLEISAIGFAPGSSGDFTVSPTSVGGAIVPGDGVDLTVSYAPMSVGPDSGTLSIATNDPLHPRLDIPIEGEGIDPTIFLFKSSVPPIPASPIAFGSVYRQSTPPPITLSIQNTGVGPLIIDTLELTAGSSADFVLGGLPTLPISIAPGGAGLDIQVRYGPQAVGQDTGAIQIHTNDRDAPLQIVSLTGEGVGCPPNLWDLDGSPGNGCEYSCTQRNPPVEICNGLDDDCNGTRDDGFNIGQACDGVGECGAGVIECHATDPTRSTCSTNPGQSRDQSTTERCNSLDDDCDGTPDNGFNLDNDGQNCGRCGTICSAQNGAASCVNRACVVASCNPNFDDCNGQYADGCEVDLRSTLNHCGTCSRACSAQNGTASCNNGNCAIAGCNTGFFDCNSTYADGCEANLVSDINTCGSCSTQCSVQNGGAVCNNRRCEVASCVAPWRDCNTSYVDGCETNTDSSIAHCGGCNQPCTVSNGTAVCNAGTCGVGTCNGVFRDCNGQSADGCETNTDSNPMNCGACNRACSVANGTPGCAGGSCTIAGCTLPFADCDNVETNGCEANLSTSILTCGNCTTSCSVANGVPTCLGGSCGILSCIAPWRDCDGQYLTGCETNTDTSLAHCGGCNLPCNVANGTPLCSAGSCTVGACSAPFQDCNGQVGDGCEINTNTSSNNCGSCGHICNLANATSGCDGAGSCAVLSCNAPFDDCNGLPVDGCEVNTNTSLLNCGGCGVICDLAHASESCNGTCNFGACDAGWVNLDGNTQNGCEYQCTVQPGPDLPDSSFRDTNCDGIDGDISTSIFVSPLGNNGNSGFYGAPVRSLATGIARALANGRSTILVAAGFYVEHLEVTNGISLYGGYDPSTWARSYANNSVIQGEYLGTTLYGIRAINVNLSTTIDGFVVSLANNAFAGGTDYGVYSSSTNSNLTLSHLSITTGNGGTGTSGGNGTVGAGGGAGSVGSPGCDGCSGGGSPGGGGASSCGRPGGTGGTGGYDNSPGTPGGTPAGGGTGGGGGAGAQGCNSGACSGCLGRVTGDNGVAGLAGAPTSPGGDGAGGSGAGSIIGGLWIPAAGATGIDGPAGAGGGGGGGGGGGADECGFNLFGCHSTNTCNSDRGGGGGGGGAGGCGGTAGQGGEGGGGTFGIFLFGASPNLSAITISTGRGGNGGNGGAGGNGGIGGSGAVGGFGPDDSGDGNSGAVGRPGGRGGHGGGGGGGVSYGIYRSGGSAPSISGVTYTIGGGGFGGSSFGIPGGTGASGNLF